MLQFTTAIAMFIFGCFWLSNGHAFVAMTAFIASAAAVSVLLLRRRLRSGSPDLPKEQDHSSNT